MGRRLWLALAVLAVAVASAGARARAQDLGHRIIGTQGLHAGQQRGAGLYVADQLVYYTAATLRDRAGAVVPIEDLEASALANALGLSVVLEVPELSAFVSFAVAAPLAHTSLRADRPELSLDRFGLGDVFVQPLLIGIQQPHVDVIAGYAVYVPTGLFRLGEGGLSRGHTTHEVSIGGSLYADEERRFFVSAIASYDVNETKRGIDLRRGDTFQIQGGVGTTVLRLVELGAVGAALWQTTDDQGSALPPALQGAPDRAYALGAELGVMIPSIGGRVGVRYLRELEARSRPEGQTLVFQLALIAWQPDRPRPRE